MRNSKWLALCMAVLLMMLMGCQSIGGLDAVKVMKKQVDVNSYEAQQTMSLHFEPASGKLNDDDVAMIRAFNDAQLTTNVKVQDEEHYSLNGKLKVAGEEVLFTMGLKDNQMVLKPEGAKSPIVIGSQHVNSAFQVSSGQTKAFATSTIELFGKHAPNPAHASVKSVTEQVMGQSLPLTQFHMEFGGNELVPWVKGLLQSVLKDEEGVKAWFMEFGKCYASIIKSTISQAVPEQKGLIPDVRKDSELFGLSAYKLFMEHVPSIISKLEQGYEHWSKNNSEVVSETKLVMDLYVDQELNLRKSDLSLVIAIPSTAGVPFKKAAINQNTEYSNVNGNVKADDEWGFSSYIALTDPGMTPGKWLRHFDSASVVHKWLKQLGITKKRTMLPVSSSYNSDWFYDGMQPPYTKNGNLMVPVRTIADRLNAQLKWEGKTKLLITDDITETVTELSVDSKQAKFGGQTIALPIAPETKDGQLYVPVRSLAQMLGFTFEVNKHDGALWFELTRE